MYYKCLIHDVRMVCKRKRNSVVVHCLHWSETGGLEERSFFDEKYVRLFSMSFNLMIAVFDFELLIDFFLDKLVNTGHLMSATQITRENQVTKFSLFMWGNSCVKRW